MVRPQRQPAAPPTHQPSEPSETPAAPLFDALVDAPAGASAAGAQDDGPARRLQQELERALVGAPAAPRWSARRSLALIVATNALLWLALTWGLVWSLRAIF